MRKEPINSCKHLETPGKVVGVEKKQWWPQDYLLTHKKIRLLTLDRFYGNENKPLKRSRIHFHLLDEFYTWGKCYVLYLIFYSMYLFLKIAAVPL